MKRSFAVLLLFLLAIYGFSGCVQPVGSISDSGGGGSDDFQLIVVQNIFYLNRSQVERTFFRSKDYFRIIGLGKNFDLNDDDLIIEIKSAPISVGLDVSEIIYPYGNFEFTVEGEYVLKGTYKGREDDWPIKVYGSEVSTGDASTGVGIEWLP